MNDFRSCKQEGFSICFVLELKLPRCFLSLVRRISQPHLTILCAGVMGLSLGWVHVLLVDARWILFDVTMKLVLVDFRLLGHYC